MICAICGRETESNESICGVCSKQYTPYVIQQVVEGKIKLYTDGCGNIRRVDRVVQNNFI